MESKTKRLVNLLAAALIEQVLEEIISQREERAASGYEDRQHTRTAASIEKDSAPLVAVFLPSGQATRLTLAAETETARETKVKREKATIVDEEAELLCLSWKRP